MSSLNSNCGTGLSDSSEGDSRRVSADNNGLSPKQTSCSVGDAWCVKEEVGGDGTHDGSGSSGYRDKEDIESYDVFEVSRLGRKSEYKTL